MSLKSLVRTIVRAAPVILANAPAVIVAFKKVRKAARKQPTNPPTP